MIRMFNELKKHSFLLYYLTAKDFKLKYRRSVFGVAWSVLNPFFMMVILSIVFSQFFRFDIPNFPVYLILGQTAFNFFNEATTTAMTSVLSSAALIKKVYIPKYIFPVEKTMFSFVNYAVSLIAVAIVMAIYRIPIGWPILLLPFLLICLFFFSMGVSLIISCMAVFFRDTIHLYGVLVTAWMYLTPIFYPFEILPAYMQKLVCFNPLHIYIDFLRNIALYNSVPGMSSFIGCVAAAIVSMVIGCLVFFKNQHKFILHI